MPKVEDRLTVAQVAERYHVSKNTVHRLMRDGTLPWWVPNGLTRTRYLLRQDVEAWLMGKQKPRGA